MTPCIYVCRCRSCLGSNLSLRRSSALRFVWRLAFAAVGLRGFARPWFGSGLFASAMTPFCSFFSLSILILYSICQLVSDKGIIKAHS